MNDEIIKKVARAIDHAVLNPADVEKEVIAGCETAKKYGVASICVKPCFVALAAKELQGAVPVVCTVIGFPHGANTTEVKKLEAEEAIANGAKEIDMVINIAKLKERNIEYVRKEIIEISGIAHQKNAILKVIIETALLTDQEKTLACEIIEEAGADYVKTSTGFASGGATLEDIRLFKAVLKKGTKMKASGGIKNLEQALQFIEEGCERLGTSRTETILSQKEADGAY